MLDKFKVLGVQRNYEWMDIAMVDTCRKADRRAWQFSFNTKTKQYYATLYRGDDMEAPFHTSIDLPKAFTEKLWYLAAPHITLARIEGKF
jgi:hypothetical protein